MGPQAHRWAPTGIGCAEVVYTTLAVLVEIAHHPGNVIGQHESVKYKARYLCAGNKANLRSFETEPEAGQECWLVMIVAGPGGSREAGRQYRHGHPFPDAAPWALDPRAF